MFRQVCRTSARARLSVLNPAAVRFQSSSPVPSEVYSQTIAQLKQGLKQAMLQKDNLTKTTIRSITADIKNHEINGGAQDEFNLYKVFNKMIKQRTQSAEDYAKQGRDDLSQAETSEAQIIESFVQSLGIASREEVSEKLVAFLQNLKAKDENMHMSKIFPLISSSVAASWNTSVELVKPLVPQAYKQVFGKK